MVWGCFSWWGVGPLVVIKGTLDQNRYVSLMSDHLVPYLKEVNEECHGVIFQEDNAPCHVCQLCNLVATNAQHPPPAMASAEPGSESHRAPLGSFGPTSEEEESPTHLFCCDGGSFTRRVGKNPALHGTQADREHAEAS